MATGDIATRSSDPLAMLTQLLTTFKGSATTTQTSSEQVSTDKATAYLQQILGGTSGLAAVSSGQKVAGMYNSTVNTQMTNDLLARASAQTAALSSTKTTTSQVGATANPLATIGMMLGGQAASALLGPALKVGKKKLGLDDMGQKISDAIFGPSGGTTAAFDVAPMNAAFDTMPINSAALQNLDNLSVTQGASDPGPSSSSTTGGMSSGEAAALGIGSAAASSALGGTAAATGSGYVIGSEGAVWGSALAGEAVAGAGATAAGATAATAGAEAAGTAAAGAGFGDALIAAGPYAIAAAAILGALQGPTSLSGPMSNVLNSLTAQLSGSGG